jgi:hypothetical protein
MTSGPPETTPPPDQIPPDQIPPDHIPPELVSPAKVPGEKVAPEVPWYCGTCRQALTRRVSTAGKVDFIHAADQQGAPADHPPRPKPLTEITDPIIRCDFCSAPDAAWIYECADQQTDTRLVTSRTVNLGDYQQRHHAAHTRSVETAAGPLQMWGERWSACDSCATLIDSRDLYGLITRVTDGMPTKYTRGKRLIEIRGQLHANYSTVFATLRPGRGHITPQQPLGLWQEPTTPPATSPPSGDGDP